MDDKWKQRPFRPALNFRLKRNYFNLLYYCIFLEKKEKKTLKCLKYVWSISTNFVFISLILKKTYTKSFFISTKSSDRLKDKYKINMQVHKQTKNKVIRYF